MKILFACSLIFLATGCGVNQGVERNYIISEAQAETQNVTSEQSTSEIR